MLVAQQCQSLHSLSHQGILRLIWCSPDLAPSDYHLFTSLKAHMGGIKFSTDEQMQKEVLKWGKELAGEFFEEDIIS
ncbi:hypothetical protein J437_LFUL011036 [Ladona fulva]|uniref:Uncharacterized protein n=1 Tax=Ladona fulva TaxID=123851 RepID=A0A8K0P423_LADFU|nr:hypothetical protein J437_LFUL011036 [Ladona fulva]